MIPPQATSRSQRALRRPQAPLPAAFPGGAFAAGAAADWNPIHTIGFALASTFVLVRFSLITDVLQHAIGFQPYLIILLGPPSVLAVVLSGGLPRCFKKPSAVCWVLFMAWLVAATPFSVWKGGSVATLLAAFKSEYPMFFIVAGLTVTMRDARRMMFAIGLGGMIDVLVSRLYGVRESGRLAVEFGTLSNANDLATHLLLTLPFVVLIALNGGRVLRVVALAAIPASIAVTIMTGSRGGLLAFAIMFLFALWRMTPGQKVATFVTVTVLGCVGLALLPHEVLLRYGSIFQPSLTRQQALDSTAAAAAAGAMESRTDLLKSSIKITLQNPIFGIGPGQFAVSEAEMANLAQRRGRWQVSHNSYTQASSEAGIPALLLLVACIVFCCRELRSVYLRTRGSEALRPVRNMALCTMLSWVGFSVAIFFASMCYRLYIPSLVGLTVAFCAAAEKEIAGAAGVAPGPTARATA